MSAVLTFHSYAKINLYLDVLNKRRDGYNNIETIFQSVSLCDRLRFEERGSQVSMSCSSPELDTGQDNLVYRAAMLLRARTGCRLGAHIHLDKHIPIAAGLAGGSGNAAATLTALNLLWNLRLSKGALHRLALELGSDVPFCLEGGGAAATRRGEDLTSLPPIEKTWFVLVHPPLAVSASHTYNHPALGRSSERPFAGKTRAFRGALRGSRSGRLASIIFNRMERPVFLDHPHLAEMKETLLHLGCTAAAMSGSGPTLFGLCASKRAAEKIAEKAPGYATSVVHSLNQGLERVD